MLSYSAIITLTCIVSLVLNFILIKYRDSKKIERDFWDISEMDDLITKAQIGKEVIIPKNVLENLKKHRKYLFPRRKEI